MYSFIPFFPFSSLKEENADIRMALVPFLLVEEDRRCVFPFLLFLPFFPPVHALISLFRALGSLYPLIIVFYYVAYLFFVSFIAWRNALNKEDAAVLSEVLSWTDDKPFERRHWHLKPQPMPY